MAMFYVDARDGVHLYDYSTFIVADDFKTARFLWCSMVELEKMDHVKGEIWQLSYHKFGPNEVIPWHKLTREGLWK